MVLDRMDQCGIMCQWGCDKRGRVGRVLGRHNCNLRRGRRYHRDIYPVRGEVYRKEMMTRRREGLMFVREQG